VQSEPTSPRPTGLHIGLIMDGNGRWASRQGLPRPLGHRAGVEAIRRIIMAAPGLGIATLTLYAFSTNNWRRPQGEVDALMALLAGYIDSETDRLAAAGIRFTIMGRRDRVPPALAAAIARAEAATAHGTALDLRVAVDYSGRDAILAAAAKVRGPHDLTREGFAQLLAGEETPRDLDLVIRTSGEQRLSDFLLWESAYAEFHFTDTAWPDFRVEDLEEALVAFRQRERTFGALPMGVAVA
jgi:undecaprenyl diphosphate synthase